MTYGMHTDAAKEYRQHGLRYEIESASPHRLIQMMMQRVLSNLAAAKAHMERGALAEKGEQISGAIDIISGLQTSLNHEAAEKLSSNFDALYDYMSRRLVEANFRNEVAGLDEVAGLMGEIKMAWDAIGEQLKESEEKSGVDA